MAFKFLETEEVTPGGLMKYIRNGLPILYVNPENRETSNLRQITIPVANGSILQLSNIYVPRDGNLRLGNS